MSVRHRNDAQVEAAIASAVARERERCVLHCYDLANKWSGANAATAFAVGESLRALPDGGATTAEPRALDAEKLLREIHDYAQTSYGEVALTEKRASSRLWHIVNTVRRYWKSQGSASSVGGATTEGTTP